MDSARWERIQSIFHDTLARPESGQQAFLETACGGDLELMAEVLAMLKADSRRASLLDRGLPDIAYRMVGTSLEPVSPREFGPYRIVRILGEGGMGVVWLAQREDAGNLVAIKFLPHAGLSPARRERFAREIKTLAKLKHPYIARLYDAGTLADGTPWFVMEYVEGARFNEYCRQEERPVEERLRLFRNVCEAVQYAHGQEIIHRDLKPSNILVERDGTPRLLDFGIARELQRPHEPSERTRHGLRFHSPDYAASEWVRDGAVGLYTDVYSLGVILYEMLTGHLPVKNTPGDQAVHAIEYAPEKPSVTGRRNFPLRGAAWGDLDMLCLKAMHKDPQERYQSVEALIRDIDHYLHREPLDARPDTLRYRLGKFVARNRRAVAAASMGMAVMILLVLFFTLRLAKERNAALAEAARTRRVEAFTLNLLQGGDEDAGPPEDLRVLTLLDRGVREAQALSSDPKVQVDLYRTLGTVYQNLGKYDRANALLQTALEKSKLAFGSNSQDAARVLIKLGLLRNEQSQLVEAERLMREALAVDRRLLPLNHPDVADAMTGLGLVLGRRGQHDQAINILTEAVRLQSTPAGDRNILAYSLFYLANTHYYVGHYAISESLNRQLIDIDRQQHGARHPDVAEELMNLANIQGQLGHFAEAERQYRQAMDIFKSWYGEAHPTTADAMAYVGRALIYEGSTTKRSLC
jgi:serine/threonine-protein kinase